MTDKFEIGEVAIYVREGSPNYGKEVIVASDIELCLIKNGFSGKTIPSQSHRIEVPSDWIFGPYSMPAEVPRRAKPEWLRKKPRQPVRESLGDWELCPWRPERVKV